MMSDKKQNKKTKLKKFDTSLDPQAKELIKQAMAASLQEKLKNESIVKKDLRTLSSVVEEFLSSFMILGYTFDGEPIHCISARNQQEADSLVTLINKYFHNHHIDEDTSEQG
jgi:hypothetical protein